MTTHRIKIRPGFNSQLSQTANESGWFSGNLVRWQQGLLQKVGGWQRLISTACAGFIRALHAWEDLENEKNLLIGTDAGPQIIVNNTLSTFQLLTGQIINQITFDSTIGLTSVAVTQLQIPVEVGDQFTFAMRCSIGGIIVLPGTTYTVTSLIITLGPKGFRRFTFDMLSAALSTETTNAVPAFSFAGTVCTVTFKNHGKIAGDTFHMDATTIFQLLIDSGLGVYNFNIPAGTDVLVAAPVTTDTFTFDASVYGSSTRLALVLCDEGFNNSVSPATEAPVINVLSTVPTAAANWFADNLGQTGLISFTDSAIYAYTPPIAAGAYIVTVGLASGGSTAPQTNGGMFTAMPQAQVIAFNTEPVMGSGVQDPLLVRFSDAGSYSDWTATVTNQAGSYRLSRGSEIIAGFQAPQTTLLWTDIDIWAMNYQGPPLIYGFTIMGTGCGIVSPKARCSIGRVTFWQGQNSFWTYGDSGVQPLDCTVWDIIFKDIDTTRLTKCFAGANSSFQEVWFFYVSLSSTNGECDKYVKYNVQQNLWDFGTLARTAWEDNSIFGPPLAGDLNFRIQQHEIGYDDDTVAMRGVYAESGFASLAEGDVVMATDRCEPDFKWFGLNGSVSVSLRAAQYPNGPTTLYGPFPTTRTTTYFTVHMRARLTALRLEWAEVKGFSARVEAIAFNVKPAGKRP